MALWTVCILLSIMFLGTHQTSGKGFYCRDPDTGKLHNVNTTWPSTTFCGNYTCRLRKKGPAETEFKPLRQFKVANVNIFDIIGKKPENVSEIVNDDLRPEKQVNTDVESKIERTKLDNTPNIENNDVLPIQVTTESDDRYLNENEIKIIANLLQGVKKSDLTAIVDIYNLAKDIHKETNSGPSKNTIDKTANAIKLRNEKTNQVKNSQHNSYWYGPVHDQNKNKKIIDMDYQGSEIVSTVSQNHESDPISYFKGTLTEKDFSKLPYYYPISSFQREYSYYYPTYTTPQNSVYTTPQSSPYSTTQYLPYYAPQNPSSSTPQNTPHSGLQHQPYPNYPEISQRSVLKNSFTVDTVNKQQPILLAYPYSYIHHYNSTGPGYYYDKSNHWAFMDMYSKYYKPYYIANVPNAPGLNSAPKEEKAKEKIDNTEKLIESLISKTKEHIEKVSSSWHTPPIANDILEDVRAHIQEKSTILKPFPLRKKVKIEKVGKVINLEELNKRSKRNVINDEEFDEKDSDVYENFEAYVERITCETDSKPGYFRMGNDTALYPACCPQRIE